MKIIAVLPLLLLTGCASVSNNDFDWKRGKFSGDAGSTPYVFDVDDLEVTFNLYNHNTERVTGQHNLEIDDDSIKYKIKYRF